MSLDILLCSVCIYAIFFCYFLSPSLYTVLLNCPKCTSSLSVDAIFQLHIFFICVFFSVPWISNSLFSPVVSTSSNTFSVNKSSKGIHNHLIKKNMRFTIINSQTPKKQQHDSFHAVYDRQKCEIQCLL